MNEIKLNMRYPESRPEDITDAYMRGFEVGLAMRTDENAKLRELVQDMYAVMVEDAANCDVTYPEQFDDRMRELGVDA